MAKFLALKTSQRVRNEWIDMHIEISYFDVLREF